jgi:hypothetical protein
VKYSRDGLFYAINSIGTTSVPSYTLKTAAGVLKNDNGNEKWVPETELTAK